MQKSCECFAIARNLKTLMAAVKVINHIPLVPHLPKDVPLPPSPPESTSPPPPVKKKTRKNKTKEKEKVKEGMQGIKRQGEQERGNANEQQESEMPQPEPLKPLTWTSLTDSNSNSHPPIFTKDGRCVDFMDMRHLRSNHFVYLDQPLLFHRRGKNQDTFYIIWQGRFYITGTTR